MAKTKHKMKRYRNAASGGGGAKKNADDPSGAQVLAAIGGGVGAAVLGGVAAKSNWHPKLVASGITVAGGIAAWKMTDNWRVFSGGVSAVGAGQLAMLFWTEHEAEKAKKEAERLKSETEKLAAALATEQAVNSPRPTTSKPAAATSPLTKPANAADGGASISQAFNQMVHRLSQIHDDDALRFGDAA